MTDRHRRPLQVTSVGSPADADLRGLAALLLQLDGYRWVRLALHAEKTGQSAGAVHALRKKRQWVDGVHCLVGPDGKLYVSPEAYNKWVEGGGE